MDLTLITHFAGALFAIMNPLGNLPVYINATSDERLGTQRYLALFLSLFIAIALLVFFWSGNSMLQFFGVSLPAFRIAGGILLLLTGIGMVRGHEGKRVEQMADKVTDVSDLEAAEHRFRSLLIPVGVPLFVGPGSISTVILFAGQASNPGERLGMSGVILGMTLVTFLLLLVSERIGKLLGAMGLDIAARLMGMILAAIGVQFMLAGFGEVTSGWIDSQALE
ncbi:MAG: MarC family protein [Verrucomicrobiales bacterium]